MNPKERVYTVLEHKKPDRVPVTNRFTPEVAGMLSEILNINSDDSFDLEVELGHDLLCTKEIGIVNVFTFKDSRQIDNNLYIDEFGVLKRKIEHGRGSYIEIVKNPLEDLNKFSSYKLPDPDKQPVLQKQLKNFKENVEKYGKTHAIVGGVTATIFEAAQHLRGIERVMVDLIENEDFLNELMDMLLNYHFRIGKKLIELGADIIYIGDDVGMQTGMLISPSLWRQLLKPRYEFLFKEWRRVKKDIIFAFHSDGYIEPIIPDFIEIGLDILNPVQPETMNDSKIKSEYGKKLSFWGGINVQKTIPFGSPRDVVNEVKDRISTFGENGGFIVSPSHNIQPEGRSIDNTFIYYWACRKYGEGYK